MTETVREWIEKAEEDFTVAQRESRARKNPAPGAVCFHAQQCVEKLMKGLLIQCGTVPPKTHDLVHLNELLVQVCPEWYWPVEELRLISRSAIACRYPGESATREEAAEVFGRARVIRTRLLDLLGVNRHAL